MIVKNLYLVTGIKYYDAYQGDSIEECVKLLVLAVDEDAAKKIAYGSKRIDELTNIRLLVWEETDGLDDDIIYSI